MVWSVSIHHPETGKFLGKVEASTMKPLWWKINRFLEAHAVPDCHSLKRSDCDVLRHKPEYSNPRLDRIKQWIDIERKTKSQVVPSTEQRIADLKRDVRCCKYEQRRKLMDEVSRVKASFARWEIKNDELVRTLKSEYDLMSDYYWAEVDSSEHFSKEYTSLYSKYCIEKDRSESLATQLERVLAPLSTEETVEDDWLKM